MIVINTLGQCQSILGQKAQENILIQMFYCGNYQYRKYFKKLHDSKFKNMFLKIVKKKGLARRNQCCINFNFLFPYLVKNIPDSGYLRQLLIKNGIKIKNNYLKFQHRARFNTFFASCSFFKIIRIMLHQKNREFCKILVLLLSRCS